MDNITGWTRKASLYLTRYAHACALDGKFLYIIGGQHEGDFIRSTEILDLETWTLQSGSAMPLGTYNGQALAYNGSIYSLFRNGKVFRLDKGENDWTKGISIDSVGSRPVYPAPVVSSKVLN